MGAAGGSCIGKRAVVNDLTVDTVGHSIVNDQLRHDKDGFIGSIGNVFGYVAPAAAREHPVFRAPPVRSAMAERPPTALLDHPVMSSQREN